MSKKINNKLYFREKFHTKEWCLTFDDVLCMPGFTNFDPEKVDISTTIGPYKFKIPILSAIMDTVTEAEMAIQIGLLGGLGVLHRNCTYEKQLKMVKKVKRARSFMIEDVATVNQDNNIEYVKEKMKNLGVSGLVVTEKNKVIGIVTARDLPLDENFKGLVKDIMTKNPICAKREFLRKKQWKCYIR